ncbi:phage tail protein [Pseudoalteromonas peptidolytica]|uniref:phage tail protein n=1 Tax=Pseudoalteromonas peptidolytica TaxID=61150 RepID=UPI00298E0EEC|nr:phage tail protein [Pseudoalteromonas peptidolytica]MDW7551274.1 phage tail protein [Pseudoalteromonas peptidolytica]
MQNSFIDIQGLVPEKLRNKPLFKDVIDALEHIYFERTNNVQEHLEAIRDKYATYLVLAKQPASDIFQITGYPNDTIIEPSVYMDEPLIKRQVAELSFGTGTHQFIAQALSLEPISHIVADEAVEYIKQITPLQRNMKEGYFEENALYEIKCAAPVRFEYLGLSHGHPVPIDSIKCETLGLVYQFNDLRNSDLYALEPGFKYRIQSAAEGFEWVIQGKKYTQEDLDLSRNRNSQIISEFGYQYLTDALNMSPLDVALVRSFLTAIHQLKGSRKGVELMLDLLELKEYVQLFEWWEDDPTGETADEMTYRVEVDLTKNNDKLTGNALQALRLFLRQYVYPVMSDFALLINFVDEKLRTAYNILPHQTLDGTVQSPLVLGVHYRANHTLEGSVASPVMLDVRGLLEREYLATMTSIVQEYTCSVNTEINTAVNVLTDREIPGATSTSVLFGMAGVGLSQFYGYTVSPIVTSVVGLVHQDLLGYTKEREQEQTLTVTLNANIVGTKGIVAQTLRSALPSPLMCMIVGQLDREFSGNIHSVPPD